MIASIPAPGRTVPSLPNARALLVNAQGIAGAAHDNPKAADVLTFQKGISDARTAAEMLLVAEPRSDFQDLAGASKLATAGADALTLAMSQLFTFLPGNIVDKNIKQHSGTAFDKFESAFEIIDND